MELNDFQKRIDKLVGKPENETQKMILPALVLEFESEVVKELCMRIIRGTGNEEVRSSLIKRCASCLGGVSMLASSIGMSLEEIANIQIGSYRTNESK